MASLAGAWSALVAGFGGMRASPSIGFGPRLPTAISRLAFRVCYRGRHLSVTVTAASATYELLDGPP
ncbi:MAG TPA: glycosyl hydrolase family 65 protein [Acidimicrobiales bacterium]